MKKEIQIAIPLFILLTGCFGTVNRVSPRFWKNRSIKIGVGMIGYPLDCVAYTKKKYLVCDEKINASNQEKEIFQKITRVEFKGIVGHFVGALNQQGFQAQETPDIMELKWKGQYVMDLTETANKADVDVLILFQIHRLGIFNRYDKEENLIHSSAMLQASAFMTEMRNGKMTAGLISGNYLWRAGLPQNEGIVPIEGDWRQPPDYPKLKIALKDAVAKAKDFFLEDFFKNAPEPQER